MVIAHSICSSVCLLNLTRPIFEAELSPRCSLNSTFSRLIFVEDAVILMHRTSHLHTLRARHSRC